MAEYKVARKARQCLQRVSRLKGGRTGFQETDRSKNLPTFLSSKCHSTQIVKKAQSSLKN